MGKPFVYGITFSPGVFSLLDRDDGDAQPTKNKITYDLDAFTKQEFEVGNRIPTTQEYNQFSSLIAQVLNDKGQSEKLLENLKNNQEIMRDAYSKFQDYFQKAEDAIKLKQQQLEQKQKIKALELQRQLQKEQVTSEVEEEEPHTLTLENESFETKKPNRRKRHHHIDQSSEDDNDETIKAPLVRRQKLAEDAAQSFLEQQGFRNASIKTDIAVKKLLNNRK